jgi:hypothetical protein
MIRPLVEPDTGSRDPGARGPRDERGRAPLPPLLTDALAAGIAARDEARALRGCVRALQEALAEARRPQAVIRRLRAAGRVTVPAAMLERLAGILAPDPPGRASLLAVADILRQYASQGETAEALALVWQESAR